MYGVKGPRLLLAALAAATLASGCQRDESADARRNANAAATQAKTRVAEARDRLADAWITTIITSKLVGDREIRARDIDVSTHDGVVTLDGRVLNEPLRQLAVALAKNTTGVTDVNDQLDVQIAPRVAKSAPLPATATPGAVATTGSAPGPVVASSLNDAAIATAIRSKYFLDGRIKQRHVEVNSAGGVVTLSGEVADEAERAQALLLARTTDGVIRVEDHLIVPVATVPAETVPAQTGPPETSAPEGSAPTSANSVPVLAGDEALAAKVKAQLSTNAAANGSSIEVTARNGVVLLEGSVPTMAIKQRALAAARSTDGVTQVVDRIRVGAKR
jgi:osmotically-inducible protein OsmY